MTTATRNLPPLTAPRTRKRRYRALVRVFIVLSGSVGSAVLAFMTQLVLTRTLNVADYGRLVALLAVVNILQVFAGYGVGGFWLQIFGRDGRAAFRIVLPTMQLISITLAIGAALLAGYVFLTGEGPFLHSGVIAACLLPVLLGQSLADTTAARLQLEERYTALATWLSASQLARFLIIVPMILSGTADLPHILAGYAAVGCVATIISVASLDQVRRRRIILVGHGSSMPPATSSRRITLAATFWGATPYCFCTIFYLVYSQGFIVIVERMLGPKAAAMYNVAFLVVSAIYMIPGVVYTKYLVSKMFRWSTHDREMFSAVFHLGVVTAAIAGIICMSAVMGLAALLVPLLFGSHYRAAIPVLMLLSAAIPVRFVAFAYGAAFSSEEHMKRSVWYLGAAALSCVIWSLLLIPPFGINGAALATVLAEVTLLAFYRWGVERHVAAVDVQMTFRVASMRAAVAYIEEAGAGKW